MSIPSWQPFFPRLIELGYLQAISRKIRFISRPNNCSVQLKVSSAWFFFKKNIFSNLLVWVSFPRRNVRVKASYLLHVEELGRARRWVEVLFFPSIPTYFRLGTCIMNLKTHLWTSVSFSCILRRSSWLASSILCISLSRSMFKLIMFFFDWANLKISIFSDL